MTVVCDHDTWTIKTETASNWRRRPNFLPATCGEFKEPTARAVRYPHPSAIFSTEALNPEYGYANDETA
jgi:hypothetical protein